MFSDPVAVLKLTDVRLKSYNLLTFIFGNEAIARVAVSPTLYHRFKCALYCCLIMKAVIYFCPVRPSLTTSARALYCLNISREVEFMLAIA